MAKIILYNVLNLASNEEEKTNDGQSLEMLIFNIYKGEIFNENLTSEIMNIEFMLKDGNPTKKLQFLKEFKKELKEVSIMQES